jgi:hypothetical protein
VRVLEDKELLKGILTEIEAVALEKFQEELPSSERENM